jgi:ubiquinone/menaquinone biosynthesis C-methylase UbiE
VYPIVEGIPDFRVAPDPWIGLADDREKAQRLAEATRGAEFEDTVRAYWAMTPMTPAPMAERFISHVLGAEERSREWLRGADREDEQLPEGPWLDLGCGTGDLLAAGPPDVTMVGVDIAMRWLVVARKRCLAGAGPRILVCACAERLPFPDGSFARALSLGLLEHCADADAVLAEARRVLRRGGVLRLRTVNRYTPLPEPHVGVWGVGLVPRRWADAYVRWRSGHRYIHHRPLSPRELARGFRRAGFARFRVSMARLLASESVRLGTLGAAARIAVDILRAAPLVRSALPWASHLVEGRGVA